MCEAGKDCAEFTRQSATNDGQVIQDVTPDRVDMTTEVLDKHYDHETKEERMERREDYLVDV